MKKKKYIPKHRYGNSKKSKIRLLILIGLFLLFLLTLLYSAWKIIIWSKDNNKNSKITDDIIDRVNITEDNSSAENVNEDEDKKSDYWYYITFSLINVDFNELKLKNSDTIGWIQVNNTNINYPFVQTDNNNYYLEHSFDNSYNEAGWIFMDYRNDSDFNDENTIIYGHSRLNKTMFGSLSKVLKKSWYENKDNHIIKLSTEKENTLWQIFSVYKIKEESYYITSSFNNDNEYFKFLNTIKERSLYDFNTNLNTNDRLLTLSTCYSDTERTVVHAKLIKRSIK